MEALSAEENDGPWPGGQHSPCPPLARGKHWPPTPSQQVAEPQGRSAPEQQVPPAVHFPGKQGRLLGPHGCPAPGLSTHSLTPPPWSTHVSSALKQQDVMPHGVVPWPQHL